MSDFSDCLLDWYDVHARKLPWRGIRDPYRTWISEAMLQQTRVETVIPYFSRFLSAFPTLSALAAAPVEDVLKQWEGLGYYSRARNLHAGAIAVMERFDGILPADPAALRTIPGIGPYTAGAIASIAFDRSVPAVDGNVIRVLSRYFGIREDVSRPDVRRDLESLAGSLVPAVRPGDYNQAVMDLGATICVPGTPECDRCPFLLSCDACKTGDAPDLPVLPKAKKPKEILWDIPLIVTDGQVLMRLRTEKLLQGLWCFPMFDRFDSPEKLRAGLEKWLSSPVDISPAGTARHVFTHQIWLMDLYLVHLPSSCPAPKGTEWIPVSDLSSLPLPTAIRAAVRVIEGIRDGQS